VRLEPDPVREARAIAASALAMRLPALLILRFHADRDKRVVGRNWRFAGRCIFRKKGR
jgi:hypothetical protein